MMQQQNIVIINQQRAERARREAKKSKEASESEIAEAKKRSRAAFRGRETKLVREHEGIVRGLSHSISGYKGRITKLNRRITSLQARADAGDEGAKRQIVSLIAEKELLGAHLRDATSQRDTAQRLYVEQAGRMKRGGAKAGRVIGEALAETAQERAARAKAEGRVRRLQYEADSRKAKHERATETIGQLQADIHRLGDVIGNQDKLLDVLKDEWGSMRRQLAAARGKSKRGGRVVGEQIKQVRELETRIRELEDRQNQSMSDLQEKETELNRVTGKRRKADQIGRGRGKVIAEQKLAIEKLKGELRQAGEQLEEARRRGASNEDIQELKGSISGLREEIRARGVVVDEQGRVIRASGGGLIYNPVQAMGGASGRDAEAAAKQLADELKLNEEQFSELMGILNGKSEPKEKKKDDFAAKIEAIENSKTLTAKDKRLLIKELSGATYGAERFGRGAIAVGHGISGFGWFASTMVGNIVLIIALILVAWILLQLFPVINI